MDFRLSPALAGFGRYPKRFLEGLMGEVRLVGGGVGLAEQCQANGAKYPGACLHPEPQAVLKQSDRVSRSARARETPATQKISERLPIRQIAIVSELG